MKLLMSARADSLEAAYFMVWEFEILDFLQSVHSPVLTSLMSFVTFLGEAGWLWILLGILLLCMKKYRPAGNAVLAALVLDFVAANYGFLCNCRGVTFYGTEKNRNLCSSSGSTDGNLADVFLCAFSDRCTGRGCIGSGLRQTGGCPGKEAAGGRDRKGLIIGRKET